MLGGLLMLGLQPGPLLFRDQPDFVWTLIGTFYIGNIVLVFLTLLLIPALAAMILIRQAILFPIVLAVVIFGVYSLNYSFADVTIAVVFGAQIGSVTCLERGCKYVYYLVVAITLKKNN